MLNVENITRRAFLKRTGAGTALVLSARLMPFSFVSEVKAAATSVQPNVFVRVDADGTVTLTCARSEMGQGVRTGMPMILADELEAD